MERLTNFWGNLKKCADCSENSNCYSNQSCGQITNAIAKLRDYEDLEEQGKLLRPPVAVGDTVYTLNPLMNGKTAIGETTADAFFCALVMLEGRFGKTVFLTREEAEAALKELEDKNGNTPTDT